MRIIGGKFKGRKLSSFHADHIRPTTDRVKESVFNILMHNLEGARVLDLFTGTGNLTCEALSRGAASVMCVEVSKKSVQIMKQNFRDLDFESQIQIKVQDAITFVKKYQGEPFDLILVDPPFTEKLAHQVLQALSVSAVVGAHTVIAIEYSRHERLDAEYGPLLRYTDRKFGDKSVAFFHLQEKE